MGTNWDVLGYRLGCVGYRLVCVGELTGVCRGTDLGVLGY